MECLPKEIDTSHSNPEKLSTTKLINMQLLVIHYLRIVHLTPEKTSIIIRQRLYEKLF